MAENRYQPHTNASFKSPSRILGNTTGWREDPILWYNYFVIETIESIARVVPSAAPSEDEIAAWQALPHDEQLRRLRAKVTHPDCASVSDATMSDVLRRAQAAAKLRHG